MGGVGQFMCEAVDTEMHALDAFDKIVDALRQILGRKGLMVINELRLGMSGFRCV